LVLLVSGIVTRCGYETSRMRIGQYLFFKEI